jgi:hypothetical protein
MTNHRAAGYWAAGLFAALLALAGCGDGSKTGEVTGTITVDNEIPVDGSSIDFIPVDGKSSSAGAMVKEGKYTAKGVPVGMSKVVIRVPKLAQGAKAKPAEGPGPAPGSIVEGELLPEKYNEKSELTFDVKSGKNEKDWNLSTKP